MSWYEQKQPKTAWDICWDFAKPEYMHAQGQVQQATPWEMGWGQPMPMMGMPPWMMAPGAAMHGPWMMPWVSTPQAMPLDGDKLMTAITETGGSLATKEAEKPKLPHVLEKRLLERKGQTAPPQPPTKEFEGSVKSLSGKHGYGFIACEEIHRLYGRDVYLPRDLVPEGTKVLDRLRFTVVLSAKGHPQATNISVAFSA